MVVNLLRCSISAASFGLLGFAIQASSQDAEKVTYATHIAPMVRQHCAPCHRENGAAPFTFNSYDDVRRRIQLIRTQVLSLAMPPSSETSDFGHFSLAPKLSADQIVMLQTWIQAGLPAGKSARPPREATEAWVTGGRTETRDVKGKRPIEAEGVADWQTFRIPLGNEPRRLRAFDLVPEAPLAMRHAVVRLGNEAGPVLGVWAPGYRYWRAPEEAGFSIPAGSELFVSVLYQPTGKPEAADFRLRLNWLLPEGPVVDAVQLKHEPFVIDAKSSRKLELACEVKEDTQLLGLLPFARFYCSGVKVTLRLPDSTNKILFETRRWNPYWIGNYQPITPISIPAGSRILAVFEYNNDENCPMNDGKPPADVKSGEGLGDEACELSLSIVKPSG